MKALFDENGDDCKIVHTNNTVYMLYEADVDPEYEKRFPGAYVRLKEMN